MKLIDLLKNIFKKKLVHTNTIEISRKYIENNLNLLRSLKPKYTIIPVLKSNAYGHGLEKISKIINKLDIDLVAVDSFPEYQVVNKYTNKNILVLGETIKQNYNKYNFSNSSFCVYNYDTINYIKSLNKKIKIHLFLNTGMNREGIMQENLQKILDLLKDSKIVVEGVCSHFSSADELDFSISSMQIDKFKEMYKEIDANGFYPKYKHIEASAGILKVQDDFFNACRPGLLFYGYNPLVAEDKDYKKGIGFTPTLSVFSSIVSIQKIKKGDGVSYNKTYKAEKNKTIGIIPFGYFEGINRKLSNNWQVKYNGKYFNIAGNVCMNLTCIDFENEEIKLGDKIELISNNILDKNNVYNLATNSETIVREVLTRLSPSIHRKIV